MKVFRISEERFAEDLSGSGARLYGGRWNPKGIAVIYTSESVALAALEMLIRLHSPKKFVRVIYQLPDTSSVETVNLTDLPEDWQLPRPNTRLMEIGRRWALERRTLLLKVPSAVVFGEGWNFLINPLRHEMEEVAIADIKPFRFDKRLD